MKNKLSSKDDDIQNQVKAWEEKCKELQSQLKEKDAEIERLNKSLKDYTDSMFEKQSELVRSSQQFFQARDNINHENVALKKNYENSLETIRTLREEVDQKSKEVIKLQTRESWVNEILEKGTVKSEQEIEKLQRQNDKLKNETMELSKKLQSSYTEIEDNK